MKDKLRSKNFWMSLIGALLVFLQTLGLTLNIPAVNEAVGSGLALLVVMGIISDDGGKGGAADGETKADGTDETAIEEKDPSCGDEKE